MSERMRSITETDRQPTGPDRPLPVLRLLYTSGELPLQRQFAVTNRGLRIGRNVPADQEGVCLSWDTRASAHHADLLLVAQGVRVMDRESKNGTFLNGAPIHEALVGDGDVLRIGSTLFLLRYEPALVQDCPKDAPALQERILGASPVMSQLRYRLWLAAQQEERVLLRGETGTGKELAAEALHASSARAQGRFVKVNCSAIPATLAESVLFGHAEGSFTGARQHDGYIREAHKGTLFLDEIGDLPLDLQPKLLRALEEGEIRPIGSARPVPCDVRFVAATNRDLDAAVRTGSFRSDLLARLAILPIDLPPLRVRREDILPLFHHGLGKAGSQRLSARLAEALLLHPWPRNVRELMAVAAYARVYGQSDPELDLPLLTAHLQPPPAAPEPQDGGAQRGPRGVPYTHETLERLLRENQGVISRVAFHLGRSRRQILRILRDHGFDPDKFRRRAAKDAIPDEEE